MIEPFRSPNRPGVAQGGRKVCLHPNAQGNVEHSVIYPFSVLVNRMFEGGRSLCLAISFTVGYIPFIFFHYPCLSIDSSSFRKPPASEEP